MRPEKAAFQGERGAFSEEAARRLLGRRVEVLPCVRFEDVFRNLSEKKVQAAVVPIENTLAGSVHENYDHLLRFELPIVAETSVRIVHNLIVPPGVPFRKLRRVYSHPVALNQCLNFFSKNPQIEKIPFYDTAGSVKMIMEDGLRDAGGIASAPRPPSEPAIDRICSTYTVQPSHPSRWRSSRRACAPGSDPSRYSVTSTTTSSQARSSVMVRSP